MNTRFYWIPRRTVDCACLRRSLATSTSPRVLAYLARRGRLPSVTMALSIIEQVPVKAAAAEVFKPPPKVVTTPCDPWPGPYYKEDGLRKVVPYHFTYNTYCKERWRGRELLDIFACEFRDRSKEYYVRIHVLGFQ